MGSYIAHFAVYTMAMIGLIFFAIFVYKKFMNGGLGGKSSKTLSIEESMNINPRKSLLIVRAGNERFLIASDVDKTTLISKLGNNENLSSQIQNIEKFERFKNIEQEYVPQQKELQNVIPEENVLVNENTETIPSNKIHLEPINGMNPNFNAKRGFDKREINTPKDNLHRQNLAMREFERAKINQRTATIREMAKKINEL